MSNQWQRIVISESTIFIIHLADRTHWVTLTNIDFRKVRISKKTFDASKSEWFLYDSLYSPDLLKSASLRNFLTKLYSHANMSGRFQLLIPDVQQQEGKVDCGLFALAIAYELARQNNPSGCRFDQYAMRDHFRNMVATNNFVAFPLLSNTLAFNNSYESKAFNLKKKPNLD